MPDALRAGWLDWRLLAESASDIVFEADPDFVVLWVSPSLEATLGIEPRQLLGRPIGELLVAGDQAALVAQQQRAAEEACLRFQGRFGTASGGSRWLQLTAVPCRQDDGVLLGWIGSCCDIQADVKERQRRRQAEDRFRLAMEASAAGMAVESVEGHFLEVNQALCTFLGRSRQELLAMRWQDVTHPEDLAAGMRHLQEVLDGRRESVRTRKRYIKADGSIVWGDLSAACMRDEDGSITAIISHVLDVSRSVEAEREAEERSQLLQTVLDNVGSCIYMMDAEHRYLYVNREVQQLFGRSLAEIVGHSDREIFSGEVLDALWAFDEEVLSSGRHLRREELVPSANGEPRWFLSNKLLLQRNGEPCLIGFSTDITERKWAEEELERSESKFRLLFEVSLDPITLLTPEGRYIDANPAALELCGAPSKEAFLRCGPQDLSPELQSNGEPSAPLIRRHLERALEQGFHQFEWLHRRLDNGEPFLALVTLKAINLSGQPALLAVARDISESRRYEERLRQLAYRDELTGLPNRAASLEHLEQLLGDATSQTGALVVVNLDLDGFQAVNDSFGLQAGDRVLIAAAASLRQWLPPGDWLARLDSDEFLVVRRLGQADLAAALRFGRELQRALAQGLASCSDLPIRPSASAGLALYPDHGGEPITLLQAANTALMEAKRAGQKAVIHPYSQNLSQVIQRRLELEVLLERAIERQQLHLVFQPQVDREGQLIGAEALLRWTLADGRSVGPDAFIPLAEQSGLMHPIGDWVIEAACAQLAAWRRQGLRLPRLAINLSAVQFENRETELDAWLMGAISRHGISPIQLELEVTETALLKSPRRASGLLYQLGAAGFRIAIDDFGTGYSSLVNLHALPVHKLKIDKSFVQRITESRTDRAIIDSTLVIARKLGLETMAEGVETDAQWQALKALGCDSFQGYLFGRPMAAEHLAQLLRRC